MPTKTKSIRFAIISIQVALLGLLSFGVYQHIPAAKAADANIADGITVDSTLDAEDTNIGNGQCNDGAGNCTLRAAIQEANANPDASTIEFNITGTADFTNGGEDGYTIEPQSALPYISEQVTINGYSQPGAQPNTVVAPNPLNGRLLIEIDGNNVVLGNGLQFIDNSDSSAVRGLVLNNWTDGDAIQTLADDIEVQGNYIGTNAAGTAAKPNEVGINVLTGNPDAGRNVLVGGLDAADRNLVSGNTAGTTGTASYPGTGWVFQGNYMGLAADGVTPIANSILDGSGIISIDHCSDVTIGGSQPGAINVFGASLGHGIAPLDVDNLLIEGNYIGLAYDGTTVIDGNDHGTGITMSDITNAEIKNNRVAGWLRSGISASTDTNDNITISGNVIHDNQEGGNRSSECYES